MIVSAASHQKLVGHDKIVQQLKSAFDEGRLHHALIFSGIEGIGKETLAYHLIRYGLTFPDANKERRDLTIPEDNRIFKQVETASHPNLKVITPVFDEKKQRFARDINLDAFNGLNDFLRLAPTDGSNRFVLIHPADSLSRITQNAILKILEEPPEKTYFILLTSQAGSLLPTIRSRCLVVPFEALSFADFAVAFQQITPDVHEDKLIALFHLTQGSVGQALYFEQHDVLGHYAEFCRTVMEWHEGDSQPAMRFAEHIAGITESRGMENLYDLWVMRLALVLKNLAKNQATEPLIAEENIVLSVWAKMGVKNLLASYDRLQLLWQEGESGYLDKKLVAFKALGILSGMDSVKQAVLA